MNETTINTAAALDTVATATVDFNTAVLDTAVVKYASTVFANGKNAYLKKAYRRNKKYREAILIKHVVYSNIFDFMVFGCDMPEIKRVCKEEGLSISSIKKGLRHYEREANYYFEEGMLPPTPATREVIKRI
jgi:hypothetical protein